MEQRKVASTDMKKSARPKSSILSRILHGNTLATATRTIDSSTEESNNTDDDEYTNKNDNNSNKLEILNREHYLMTTSFSSPTTTIGTYTQLRAEYNTLTQALSPEIQINNKNCDENIKANQDIIIPSRRQSNLYTPYHDRNEFTSTSPISTLNTDYYNSKRRSYYLAPPTDASMSNNASSLSRSATWQPSSSLSASSNTTAATIINDIPRESCDHDHITNADIIPARRTSRNYATNPEIQAKLDAMLKSDKAVFLSKTLAQHHHHTQNGESNQLSNNDTNSNVRRRSTTPGHY